MTDATWLENLQPGDEVVCFQSYDRVPQFRKVDRVTKTQVIVGDTRYSKRNGFMVGGDTWCRTFITQPNEQHRFEAAKHRLAKRLRKLAEQVPAMEKEDVAKWLGYLKEKGTETK